MAADIQIIVETIGSESVLEATKRIGKLDRGAKSLYNSFKKGLITNHQAIKGLYELAEANKTAHASAKANYTALTPYVNAIMKLSNEQRKASKATKAAAASERVYSSSLNNSAAAARNAGLAVNHLGVQATRAQVKTKRFASVGLQQVGYQVGDFAVQVQGGTNALVALGQQGSQLLGILGPMGAIAGAALAIWTAIARVNQETSDTAILWDKVWSDLKKSVEPVSGILEGMSDALNAVGNAFISFANLVLNNMERIVVYASILVGVIGVKLTKAFIVSGRAAVVFGKMVKGAIASTGIGLFVVGLGEAYIKLAELVRGFKQSQEAMLKYGSVWVLVWTAMKEVFLQIPTALSYVVAKYIAFKYNMLSEIQQGVSDWLMPYANWLDQMTAGLQGWGAYVGSLFAGLKELIVWPFKKAAKEIIEIMYDTLNSLSDKTPDWMSSAFGLDEATAALREKIKEQEGVAESLGGVWDKVKGKADDAFKAAYELAIGDKGVFSTVIEALKIASQNNADFAKGWDITAQKIGKAMGIGTPALQKIIELLKEGEELGINVLDWFGPSKLKGKDGNGDGDSGWDLDQIESAFTSFFNSIVDKSKSVADAFKDMIRSILASLWELLVTKPIVESIMGALAPSLGNIFPSLDVINKNGNAFSGGKVVPFANGGVVSSPTLFPMSGGQTGLMGEAGPEAIMPLKRTSSGELGVVAEGSGTVIVHQNFNFQANGDESVKRIIAQAAPQISKMTQRDIVQARKQGGTMKAVFS